MRSVRRHDDYLAGSKPDLLAGDDNFPFALEDMHQSIEWCGMLAQALSPPANAKRVTVPAFLSMIVRLTTEPSW